MRNMRDVTIDELFSWKDSLGWNAKEFLGSKAAVSEWTFAEMKNRADVDVSRLEQYRNPERPTSLNRIDVVVVNGIPDGILRPISHCKESA